jgi:hypothetical protein
VYVLVICNVRRRCPFEEEDLSVHNYSSLKSLYDGTHPFAYLSSTIPLQVVGRSLSAAVSNTGQPYVPVKQSALGNKYTPCEEPDEEPLFTVQITASDGSTSAASHKRDMCAREPYATKG